jgi:hypothetical protein
MKLVRHPSKIIGVQVGEIDIHLVGPPRFHVRFMLLRDPKKFPGVGAGQYDKTEWSPKTSEALEAFVAALEEEVLLELFDMPEDDRASPDTETPEKDEANPLSFPTLGGD